MNRIHLVILWHMHQPYYRDPATGRYLMPWTRLHALKDYWGIVHMLREFPGVHATLNVVPSLGAQLEEYAGGQFAEPWFDLATRPADSLEPDDKRGLLDQGFQVNRDTLLRRWPRYLELFQRVQEGADQAVADFGPRDWRDLQVLSQLAWMDEEYLAHDPVVSALSAKGANYTEDDRDHLKLKQLELLARVLPEYREASDRGQIEISTTPFYHPILPLLCDTDIARVSNPSSPPVQPAFRHPEDAREQLRRARAYHERVFGRAPAGLWPSEGSVSDQTLDLAIELGFRWFATDEGVLGRTLNVGFTRDAAGVPENTTRMYAPLRVQRESGEICGLFRDHYLSDLVGFVYSRMPQETAAEDLHRRLRVIGERVNTGRPLTLSLILDGENAWEYFHHNGREFLRQFYRRIEADPDIDALTASEALDRVGQLETSGGIFPGSWINANFDVWAGHAEDVAAWDLLREARAFYATAAAAPTHTPEQLAAAYESLLAAEGSDWCWWYGPEHSSAHDAEFDDLYRRHLTAVYAALGAPPPEALSHPIKRRPEHAVVIRPAAQLNVRVDGRETSYFEWLGAGLYAADRLTGAMHGRVFFLRELHYGYDQQNFYLRVDPFADSVETLDESDFIVTVKTHEELKITARVSAGKLQHFAVESNGIGVGHPEGRVAVAFDKILELQIARDLLAVRPNSVIAVGVGLWHSGLPVDLLPSEGLLELQLESEP